jgi:transposase
MLGLSTTMAVYVHRLPIDFRKSINGLAALVERELRLDPFADACYVFSNKRRDKVKILVWQRNGFWLCYKRLEQDRFVWPQAEAAVMRLSMQQLQWLLSGVDLRALGGHPERVYRRAG